jgi:hypothetical protein
MSNRQARIRTAEVDNPYFAKSHPETSTNPRRVRAIVNVRESAIVMLATRGFLKQHQVHAATRFGNAWEIMAGMHRNSLHEFVDAHQHPSISQSTIDAGRELQQCRTLLGHRSYGLVTAVCGEGKALPELYPVKRERLTAADILRMALDDMACMWGYM